MTDEQIEAVARALCRDSNLHANMSPDRMADHVDRYWPNYTNNARAAIAAYEAAQWRDDWQNAPTKYPIAVWREGWIKPRCAAWSSGSWWINNEPYEHYLDFWAPMPPLPEPPKGETK